MKSRPIIQPIKVPVVYGEVAICTAWQLQEFIDKCYPEATHVELLAYIDKRETSAIFSIEDLKGLLDEHPDFNLSDYFR